MTKLLRGRRVNFRRVLQLWDRQNTGVRGSSEDCYRSRFQVLLAEARICPGSWILPRSSHCSSTSPAQVWSSVEKTSTVDRFYDKRVRGTRQLSASSPTGSSGEEVYLSKERKCVLDTDLSGHGEGPVAPVRFSVQLEHQISEDDVSRYLGYLRVKKRTSFLYKAEFRYDLTQVQQGSTVQEALQAPPQYEIELEWCGQSAFASAKQASAASEGELQAAVASRFLHKVKDLVAMHHRGETKHAQAAGGGPTGSHSATPKA